MNELTKISHSSVPALPKDAIAYWDAMASNFARAAVASQIMCGFSLIQLKKEADVKPGQPKKELPKAFGNTSADDQKSGLKPNVFGFDSWPKFIEATYGFSEDTARNRMKMAEGVKSKFKKLGLGDRFKALLQTHPSEWSQEDTKLISDALQKVTDGMTQTDFFRQLGMAKKAPGNAHPTGGKRGPALEDVSDPLLELENDLISLADENDATYAEIENSARLERFSGWLKTNYDRAQAILTARRKS